VRPPLVDRLLAAILPWRCVLCRDAAAGMDLCIDCLNDLPWLHSTCRLCGIDLPASIPPSDALNNALANPRICGACSKEPPQIDRTISALRYEFPVAEMVATMKFGKQICFARVLGELLTIRIQELSTGGDLIVPDLLVPVPLSHSRQFRRGFNQSEVIASSVARVLHIPVENFLIKRIRNTAPQSGLKRTARQQNIRGCFRVNNSQLAGKHIAIIDDVITTGSTVAEITRVLKKNKVGNIQVWSVART
jgi:ComF family protein